MISAAEVRRNVRAAFRLGQRDAGGLAELDPGPQGTLRSFWAALPALPAYVLLVASDASWSATPVAVLVDAIAYVIGWTIFPVLMQPVARALGRLDRWPLHVTAYNWLQVTTIYLSAALVVLGLADVLPEFILGALGLGMLLWVLSMEYSVARIVLRVGAGPAVGVVALDLLLGYAVQAATRLLGG